MTEDETSPNEDAQPSAPETPTPAETSPVLDFSALRGFQTVEPAVLENPEVYQVELVKELVARAERFVQSVDSSIVLASDGVIRWLGDPIARLVAGDDLLKPRAVLLADDALPAENREAVERRLMLWIAAHLQKILGPLQGLAAPESAPASVVEVAQKLVEALGVLNRDDVRKQVKALDQNARSALRKLGVRFGANYVFVPALLKPGARALCLQLWGLKHGAEPDSDKLIAYAAAGRTSFPVDGVLSPNAYRIAGFRLCGERVVRVDIVERLTDLIRAAIPELMRAGAGGASGAAGFIVTQQMTSLTGCAGEAFASILRSLGYESHQVKKSEYEATRRKPEPPKAEAVAERADDSSAPERHSSPESEPTEAEIALALVESEGEAPMISDIDEPATESAVTETVAEASNEPAPEEDVAAAAPIAESPEETVVEAGLTASLESAAPTDPDEAPGEPIEANAPIAAAESEPTGEEASDDSSEVAPSGEAAAPPPPEEDPLVEVWRPAPRRQAHPNPHHHHHRRQPLPPEGTGRIVWRAREPKPAPQPVSPPSEDVAATVDAAGSEAGEAAPPHGQRHGRGQDRGDRRGGPPPFKGKRDDRREDRPQGDRPPRKEPRPVVVDPDSPFAKLAALRPLLERRDKRS